MSFLGGSTDNRAAEPTQILGLNEEATTTNQQTVPVPYLAGYALMGITWLDWFRNFHTYQSSTGGGGK
ncbi:MAG: hypothetical protein WA117_20910 [Verrucomicrobiia bacterium]